MSSATETWALNQFPQPARPPNSYDLSFQHNNNIPEPSRLSGQPILDDSYRNVVVPSMTHHEGGEGKDNIGKEAVKHIVEEMHDKLAVAAGSIFTKLEGKGLIQNSKELKSRGVDQMPDEGSSHKLERFKIRTVVAEEVVKEDDKK